MPEPAGGSGLSTAVPQRYRRLVSAASRKSGVPVPVVAAQIDLESGWDPSVTSPAGAEGIAQFEPGTWDKWGKGSPFVPRDAFPAYGRFMGYLLGQEQGDLRRALAAYNAGEGNVPAGYPYADEILSAAGQDAGPRKWAYRDPLRDVQGLTAERVDMGVDYSGSGPVYALGPGVITAAGHQWAGAVGAPYPGTWITEKLTSGPLKGQQVYVAEDVFNVRVRPGQRVTAATRLGDIQGGIETGFAAPGTAGTSGETLAASLGQQKPGPDPGGWASAAGESYSKVIATVGGPPGAPSGQVHGSMPRWWDSVSSWFGVPGTPGNGGGGGGILGIPGEITTAFQQIGQTFADGETAVQWLVTPSNWVRIFAGIAGTALVIYGAIALARPKVNVPGIGTTPVVPAGELGPGLGIAAVTAGSVGLFVAFHQLPPDVTDFGSFISHLQKKAQDAPKAAAGGGSALGTT